MAKEKVITRIFNGETNYAGFDGAIDFEDGMVVFACGEYECEPFLISVLEEKLSEHKAKLNVSERIFIDGIPMWRVEHEYKGDNAETVR